MSKVVRDKSGVPYTSTHYAIITFRSVYTPGDERSRTNPGHGYPASTDTYTEYTVFDSKEEMLAWIKMWGRSESNYIVIEGKRLTVTTEIQVDAS